MKSIFIVLSVFLLGFHLRAGAQKGKAAMTLNGATFKINLEIMGEKRPGMPWTTDEISFRGGKLISKIMGTKEGFPPFNCSFSADSLPTGIKIRFSASGANKGGSSITWEGTIEGNQMEGTAVWTNANGPQAQTFTGTRKGVK